MRASPASVNARGRGQTRSAGRAQKSTPCQHGCPPPEVCPRILYFRRRKGDTIQRLRGSATPRTEDTVALFGPTVLRLAVGVVFAAHGAQKLFGLVGRRRSRRAPPRSSPSSASRPRFLWRSLVGLVESVGGLLLIAGAFTLIAAAVLTVNDAASPSGPSTSPTASSSTGRSPLARATATSSTSCSSRRSSRSCSPAQARCRSIAIAREPPKRRRSGARRMRAGQI